MALRAADADAGGLVIATDQERARGIAEMMRWRLGTDPAVVTSDDPTASARIARFAAGSDPWLIAVRMVSEGVDIPRLAVGVYATTTTTSCSSARPSAGSSAGNGVVPGATRRSCTCRTTRGCGPGRSRSPMSAATASGAPTTTTRRCRRKRARSTSCAIPTASRACSP